MSVEIVLHGALEHTAQPLALTHVAHVPRHGTHLHLGNVHYMNSVA